MEIDLLKNYPKSNRNTSERANQKTEYDREIARKFDIDFFDGDRKHGYGGFNYNKRFWDNVIPDFINHWQINNSAETKLLDVGCAKGFMLFDFKRYLPNLTIKGIDISKYAIDNSLEDLKEHLSVADAKNLPFENNSFNYVISINTIHNLELDDCKRAIQEIQRVKKQNAFITVDAYRNEEERKKMFEWNLTAKTILSTDEWKKVFKECNYTGDYYWFIP